jgi:arylformamidase
MDWIDVSQPIREGITVWPGDPPVTFQADARMAAGDRSNTSVVSMSTHTGTHVDAPWHTEASGKRLDAVDANLFFGKALILEFPGQRRIDAPDLETCDLLPRLLLKTDNSLLPADAPFQEEYACLTPEAAELLVKRGVRLIGVDYLSVSEYKEEGHRTHHALLGAEMLIVEGLRLRSVPAGVHEFVVLPLPLAKADGAPCRAFVGVGRSG